ncbi:hypothetical protein [Pseudonocardia sp. ICBG601]|uniref:hypothetical protein n=1 Tax=Pseudonocardia sp. ICBG601 TaxID=2846759 RepID=UPI001CF6C16C|nr:hypothetical protein [Pseudonocardia sp. ICBG601]
MSGSDVTPGVRERQHGNVVRAAAEAGVGHVVYTSAVRRRRDPPAATTGPTRPASSPTTP